MEHLLEILLGLIVLKMYWPGYRFKLFRNKKKKRCAIAFQKKTNYPAYIDIKTFKLWGY